MPASADTASHTLFQTGDTVKLVTTAGNLRSFAGKTATVRLAFPERVQGRDIWFANLLVHDGSEHGVEVRDVPADYLRLVPAETQKPKRRSPLNLHEVRDNRTEAEKQQEGIDWLRGRGYRVLVVGQYMKKVQCTAEGCGHWFWPKGFGNSVGYPDLTIFHPSRWGAAGLRRAVMLVEYKQSEKAERKPKQLELAQEGVSAFVWSLDTLLREVYHFEDEILHVPVHPDIVEWLIRHNCPLPTPEETL